MSDLRTARWLFALLLGLYLLGARGHFLSTDEVILYQVTQSLWEKGSLAVSIADQEEAPLGRDGRHYAQYGPGQSVAALPLYGLGRAVETLLRPGSAPYRAFQQGRVSRPGVLWSGEVELFFVSLLNSLLTAAAVAVFFLVLRQDGIEPPWALAWSLVLGAAAYLGSLSSSFFQHPSEALFALAAFYLFRADEARPSWRRRAAAGVSIALMLQFRPPAVFALPGLVLLHGTIVLRRDSRRLSRVLGELAPVTVALFASFALLYLGQHAKFGDRPAGYAAVGFSAPILLAVRGYLVSPGLSLFFYAPVLLLALAGLPSFVRARPLLAAFLAVHGASYLVGYGTFNVWHGMVCFGPRYLSPLIPFLLLPAAHWSQARGAHAWRWLAPLVALGAWVQLLNVAVSFWAVAQREGYLDVKPYGAFLFSWTNPPLLAHARALLAWDDRVDFWLANLARVWGPATALVVALAPAALMALAIAKLAGKPAPRPRTRRRWRLPAGLALVALLVTWRELDLRPAHELAPPNDPPEAIDAGLMRRGMDALSEGRPQAAEPLFRRVLRRTVGHYGAHFQLARTLDAQRRRAEALELWRDVAVMAERNRDDDTLQTARRRLAEGR